MANFSDEVVSPQFAQDLDHAAAVLETACQTYVISIFGPETCANGIDTLVAATRSTNYAPARRPIVGVATEGMRMLTVSEDVITEERTPEFGSILREWIATDAATAETFVLWAQHIHSGLDESVSALERAVELAPDNGRYRYWLAHGYIDQGRFDEAIEHFNLARDTIPDDFGFTPESIDRGIREAERARDTAR
jgi:tetratricopeptide (TPR) repeat protein